MDLQSTINQNTSDISNNTSLTNTSKTEIERINPEQKKVWTIEDSEKLYRIQGWGNPYFSINSAGHITVSPKGDLGGSIDLFELIESIQQRNIGLPLIIRFSDILEDRIERLNACFSKAIARYKYQNIYRGVFPVKCNQNRQLVEEIVEFGKPHKFGLEAGSKPELLIAIATLNTTDALIICNGYKDREYIETAMLAQGLGKKTIIVIEQLEEVQLVIEASRKLNIKPAVGVRVKLSTKGIGRWAGTTGDRAKFGLGIPEIIQVVNQLKNADILDSLQLLHFHIGSQISSISVIKDAIREASQIYVELAQLGANMKYLDVGGGLAVDYDGSKSKFYASKNYDMQNYANDIVAEVKEACEEKNILPPILVSESGRAVASHQSVLIFDVLGVSQVPKEEPEVVEKDEHLILQNLYETYQSINKNNYQEAYHDAIQFKEESISLFNFGYLSISDRAKVEQLYWGCFRKIQEILKGSEYIPDDLEELEKIMASIYYINLSVFQSAPDSWAINQLFPIMPIHRLDEEPTEKAILADLTCDSDGKIEQFIDLRDVKSLLELHPLQTQVSEKYSEDFASQTLENYSKEIASNFQPYYLAMFLGGAYQEIMGNLHNLFGDVNVLHIKLTPSGYKIEHVVKGDTMTEVLNYVQYNSDGLVESIRRQTEQALQEEKITIKESRMLLQNYENSLSSYTYLSN
ncbi:biosynthetic arginine decarboxylase [Okeania sp. KiyG1]|uniref:biosynthetic arginine decarboxylase n=1 Tax=Okeania sp. KiyG1 TaxID=2720165 RepID=UPI0019249E24|nr:biosynthetic arginine decarboxylase [Okeania sp. KiyG1]GGA33619.1 biosynthetic arginine decarboxylase [Okeania sp. KiyG1]